MTNLNKLSGSIIPAGFQVCAVGRKWCLRSGVSRRGWEDEQRKEVMKLEAKFRINEALIEFHTLIKEGGRN